VTTVPERHVFDPDDTASGEQPWHAPRGREGTRGTVDDFASQWDCSVERAYERLLELKGAGDAMKVTLLVWEVWG